MKTVIIAMLLATAIVSPSNAGNGIIIEQPCGNKCSNPLATRSVSPPPAVGSVRFRDLRGPDYQSRSQTVIRSPYGTSVINSTYRSYSR